MPDDSDPELCAEIVGLLVRRVRLGLAIIIAGIPLFAVVDLLAGSQPLALLYTVKLCELVLAAAGYVAVQRPRIAPHAALLACLQVAVNCAAIAFEGILIGEFIGAAILCVSMALGSGMLLPWGASAQLAAAAAAATAVGTNFYWVHGGLPTPANYTVAVAVLAALATSVGMAYELRWHWVRFLRENLERKRTVVQVRLLNEHLERRVQERTVELEGEVAEHLRTAKALRESQKQLQDIIDNSTAAIYVKDVEGHYLLVNSWWESLSHVTRTAVVGKTDYDLFPAETAAAFRTNDLQVLQANQPLHFEEIVPHDDGVHTYVSVKFPMYDAGGVACGVCGISTDITALKQAEDRARQHQAELAHVLRLHTIGEIVAGVAHEINQPLGAIANYARGCQRRIQSGTVDLADLGQAVDQIAGEAMRASEILRRLRPLVRKEPPRDEAVDINHVVSEAARVMRSEAHLRGTTIRVATAPDRPTARGDSIQIEQVVVNLLFNAIEALESRPSEERELTVRTSIVDNSEIEVSVCDTGVGLAPAIEDKLFDAFFTTKPNGLGMGLAISRSIIDAHYGRLWVTPNPDRGSTFHFTLPLVRTVAAAPGA